MTVRILPIAESHIEGFWAAVDAVSRERKYLSFLEGPPLESSRLFVKRNLDGGWPHFVALEGEQVVGWCDVTPVDRPVARHIGVLGMGVLAAWRGQGIGEALMRSALQSAQAKGLKRVELNVHATNQRAAALYRKVGFVEEGIKRKAVLIDGVYDDSIMMARLFD